MRLLLVLAFVAVPLVELAVVLQVRTTIGLGPTLLLLLAVSLVGAAVVRREGSRAWRAFRGAVASGRPPATEVADGAMLLVGGTLLLTPGFVTDIVGLVLVLPPTRALLRRRLTAYVARRLVVHTLGVDPLGGRAHAHRRAAGPPRAGTRRTRGAGVVDGEVVDPAHRDGGGTPS